ncbi:hypothetical protein BB559_002099 [Furculomyces boomerangus]|uniref:Major facilitator superfamily (MFS) profile domain-containing protein n=1 Tax=Furculomyces boomerangus TaxID=61424 RepID=A0A2T9YY28_9FUNG|nr:hypothetical protein BB559_002099 [Furculomyces boomerangus]
MFLAVTLTSAILIKPRGQYKPSSKIIDIKLLKDPIALGIYFGGFFMQTGMFVVLMYFPSSLVDYTHISRDHATSLFMIYGAFAALGRVASGFLAKRVDPVNATICGHFMCVVLLMTMWFSNKILGVYMVFLILFALSSSPYPALSPVIVAQNYPIEKIGQVNAFTYLFSGISTVIGLPVAGLIFQNLGKRVEYNQIMVMTAIFYLLSALCMIALKFGIKRKSKTETEVDLNFTV